MLNSHMFSNLVHWLSHCCPQVLTEKDHCYCVLLNSHDGAAFPSADVKTDKDSSGSNTNTDPRRVKDPKV